MVFNWLVKVLEKCVGMCCMMVMLGRLLGSVVSILWSVLVLFVEVLSRMRWWGWWCEVSCGVWMGIWLSGVILYVGMECGMGIGGCVCSGVVDVGVVFWLVGVLGVDGVDEGGVVVGFLKGLWVGVGLWRCVVVVVLIFVMSCGLRLLKE